MQSQLASLVLIFCRLICVKIVSSSTIMVVTRFDEDFPQYEYDTTSGTPYKNCGGSESVLKSVEIIPCDLKSGDRCVLDRGTNVTFKMSFLSEKSSKTLQAKIYGIIDYIPVPFPFPQPNACKDIRVSCPIIKGQLYNYSISAPVKSKYPKGSLWIKGELIEDTGNLLVCLKIPVRID
ncbi:Epididymal secretory protein E1 [Folsomia candida]|uniref:Epididymal secretory protein E1 n=1 Tax=Folsomia candida TaxID=158441 RepID=A0A226ELV6_FOLCA|nr:Epididymal secretory protein E1 [Folsomia candida]